MSGPAATVRVLAADVDRFRGSRAGLVRLLRDVAPDVALLHRVPTHPLSGHRLGGLASDVGLVVVDGGRRAGGAALLVSLRVQARATTTHRGARGGVVVSTLSLTGGQTFRAATVDASGDDTASAAVAAHLLGVLGAPDARVPTLVAGPLPGTAPGVRSDSRLARVSPGAAPTSPASEPVRRPLGLLGRDAEAHLLGLPGEPGRRPVLLSEVLAARPTLVELTLR
jgi:hypothetical protein